MPKLTIITINRNNAAGLRKTIESVVSQTYTDFEYIVIDGASTDESVSVIKKYVDKIDYWVSEPDKGIFNAMNKGILRANGEYLLFLNSGDWIADSEVINDFIAGNFNVDIISGNTFLWKDNQATYRAAYNQDEIHYGNFYRGSLLHASSFIKKELFDIYGMYSEHYKIVSDWEFFFKVLILHERDYIHFDRVISYFDLTGISNVDEMRNLQNKERTEVLESTLPLIYKGYKILISKYDELLLHEPEYREYQNIKNGKFSYIIKLILLIKKIKF